MIGSLRGRLLDRGPDGELLIEVGGVGHRVQVTPSTSVTIGELEGEVFVHTHHAVREDSETLYGFATVAERRVFESLISAHGVGPALGLAVLSVHGPDALRRFGPERTTFGRDAMGEYTAATRGEVEPALKAARKAADRKRKAAEVAAMSSKRRTRSSRPEG